MERSSQRQWWDNYLMANNTLPSPATIEGINSARRREVEGWGWSGEGGDVGGRWRKEGRGTYDVHRRTDPLVAILEVTALVYSKKLITSGVWTWMFPQNYGWFDSNLIISQLTQLNDFPFVKFEKNFLKGSTYFSIQSINEITERFRQSSRKAGCKLTFIIGLFHPRSRVNFDADSHSISLVAGYTQKQKKTLTDKSWDQMCRRICLKTEICIQILFIRFVKLWAQTCRFL